MGTTRKTEQLWSKEMIYRSVAALIKDQKTISLDPDVSVQEAAEKMAEHRIGAIPIVAQGKLTGIFTERDLLNRVVAKGLLPQDIPLEQVMTRDPVSVDSNASLVHSLSIMFEHKLRHLPIQKDGKVVSVLSCRDMPASYWIKRENWLTARNELGSAAG
jgi:CBS domain-containing protein